MLVGAVSSVGSPQFRFARRSQVVFVRLYRPELVRFVDRHYPTHNLTTNAGKEALARVKRANLAMAAAVYAAKALPL